MTQHTPGPWEVHDYETVSAPLRFGQNCCGMIVAKTHGVTMGKTSDDSECAANARLIAAAPELLAALLRIREAFYVKGKPSAVKAALEGTTELIAKATGK